MMKDLSMHILDITQNSVRAEATKIIIEIYENEEEDILSILVEDNGKGMSEEMLSQVRDPFTTSRTTRKVGLGIPMLEQTCLQCGGRLVLDSKPNEGTIIKAEMKYNNIDRPPLGDIINSLFILLITNQDIIFKYKHKYRDNEFMVDTEEITEILGGVPLDEPEVSEWLKEYIYEGITSLKNETME